MQLRVLAIGKAKRDAMQSLTADYLDRIQPMGRQIGIGAAKLYEGTARGNLQGNALCQAESELLLAQCGDNTRLVALDERGRCLDSTAFAQQLGKWRDSGVKETLFAIGGANGHAPILRERANLVLSLSQMTWPHMLARVMLAEQLYRAVSILANHPYHREG